MKPGVPTTRTRRLITGLLAAFFMLLVLEGTCSLFVFLWDGVKDFQRPLPERRHSVYDSELGWVNAPGIHDPDMYAKGRGFTSNARGFRNGEEIEPEVPAGRVRVIASGDSFTLGYGVGDADTWPARLGGCDPGLQVVNMGQGGYGLDQAWLWYRRDGLTLDHDLVLFAFIDDDFERMRGPTFWGYGKPLLRLVEGELALTNVPVPKSSFRFPLLTQNLKLLENLRVVELGTRLLQRVSKTPAAPERPVGEDEARAVAESIFARLDSAASERGVRVVLVLLPRLMFRDRTRLVEVLPYVRAACERAAESGLPFFDLHEEFAPLDPEQRQRLFIPPGEIALPGATGHYSAQGNEFVARAIHSRLLAAGLLAPPGEHQDNR